MQRLDKTLSEAGVASRKDLRTMIKAGRVCVNGVCLTEPDVKIDEQTASITVDGVPIGKKCIVVLMLNKPAGYVTATEDDEQQTVMDLIPEPYRRLFVVPVGRLDKETEGLLLFTNDGALVHHLISPKNNVWKTYLARHVGIATQQDVDAFAQGITLRNGEDCLSAVLRPIGNGVSEISVREGKYHQVRRMMAARGLTVNYLRRIREGELELGDLQIGKVRELSEDEIAVLYGKNKQKKI